MFNVGLWKIKFPFSNKTIISLSFNEIEDLSLSTSVHALFTNKL